jgi:DNA-binding PadR family transcriptional regulator
MSARHALLGLLLEGEAYPYQLGDRLQRRLGPAWKVNSGTLYKTIKGLEHDKLIARVQSSPGGREDRHVYAITTEGAIEFERWFEQTTDDGPAQMSRRPLLIQIALAGPRRLKHAVTKVDEYEEQCEKRLAEVACLRAKSQPAQGQSVRVDELLLRLNLSADVFQLEGELQWARHAREILSWLSNSDAVWPASYRERRDAGGRRPDRVGPRTPQGTVASRPAAVPEQESRGA